MVTLKNSTAIKALPWLLALAFAGFTAEAAVAGQVVGTVVNLSGPLLVHRANGVDKVLSSKSTVEQGDVLVSEKDTYAQIKFIDNSEITLRPNTQFKIENFSYDADKPDNDHALFSLIKGGLRSITGLLGKRNHDRYGLSTPTATIGIRGTIFIAQYVPPTKAELAAYMAASVASVSFAQYGSNWDNTTRSDAPRDFIPASAYQPLQLAQNTEGGTGGLNPGLYVQVLDGTIHVTNGGGTQNFTAGQFGFTPGFQQPPVILPTNPGMQFTPPPSFSSTTGSQGGTGGGKPGDVNCQVR